MMMKYVLPVILFVAGVWASFGWSSTRSLPKTEEFSRPGIPPDVVGTQSIGPPLGVEEALKRSPHGAALRAFAHLLGTKSSNEDFAAVIDLLGRSSDAPLKNACVKVVWHHWLKADADGVWQYVKAESTTLHSVFGSRFWGDLFEVWAGLDADEARRRALALAEPARSIASEAVKNWLAARDPRTAILFDLDSASPETLEGIEELWDQLAAGKGDEIDWSQTRDLPRETVVALVRGVFGEKAKEDPKAAIEEAFALGAAGVRGVAVDAVVAELARRSPLEAKVLLEAQPHWAAQSGAIKTVAKHWINKDAKGAMAWVSDSLVGRDRFTIMSELLCDGMGAQPQRVASIAEGAGGSSVVAFVDFASVGGRLADEAPEVSWNWLTNLDIEATAHRMGAASAIVSRMASEDLEGAMALYDEMDWSQVVHPVQLKPGFSQGVAEELGRMGRAEDVEAWIERAPVHDREMTVASLMKGWVERDPNEAAAYVDSVADVERRNELSLGLVKAWSKTEPQRAAEWLSSHSAIETVSADVVAEAIEGWSAIDPMAASEWLATVPPGENLDQGSCMLAQRIVGIDPQSAADWALSIQNEETRVRSLARVFSSWERSRGGEAFEALDALDLTPEVRAEIIGKMPMRLIP